MPIVPASNAYLVGIAKQSSEGSVPTTAEYSLPVYASDLGPRYDERTVEVTDASAIEGDSFKSPSYWQADGIEVPAFADSLGEILVGMWATDTASGTAPTRSHAFSGLGGTQPFMAFYSHWTDSGIDYEQTFGKGLITGLTFGITEEGGPLRVRIAAVGQEVTGATTAAFPATSAELLTDGFFGMQLTNAKIELDIDTPNVNPSVSVTNVQNLTLNVTRGVTPVPTATGQTVTNLSQGKVATDVGQMTVLWNSVALDTYRASYFGSAAGTSLSSTQVYGALELTFQHTVEAPNSTFVLYLPKVKFRAQPAVPNPDGSPLTQTIDLKLAKPTSGDHVVPTLVNNVTPAY